MMLRAGRVAAACLLLLGLGAAAPAQTVSGATRQQIAARYARYDRLDASRDMQAVLVWYLENTTGDYRERRPGGRVTTRSQVLGAVRQLAAVRARGAGAGIRVRSRTALLRLAKRGAAGAVADTKVTVAAAVPPAPGRAAATVTTVETHRDTWVAAGGRWRIKQRDVLTHSTSTARR
jgi:hypothetical protein